MGEEVSNCVSGAVDLVEGEVKFGKEFEPTSLAAGNFVGLPKVGEILVIHEDADRVMGAKEVMAEVAKGMDDHVKLTIEDVIVDLGTLEGGRKEANGVFDTVIINLNEGTTNSKGRGISVQYE